MRRSPGLRRHEHACGQAKCLGRRGARRLLGEVVQLVRQSFKDFVRRLAMRGRKRRDDADAERCESRREIVGGEMSIGQRTSSMDQIPERYRPFVEVLRTKRAALKGRA